MVVSERHIRRQPPARVWHPKPAVTRWIAFDSDTADAIRKLFGDDSGEIRSGDPLTAALELSKPSVVVLPSSIPGKALLAHFRLKTSSVQASRPSIAYEPTGFLGLTDTPVFEEEVGQPPAPKKHWWERKKTS